MCFGMPATIVGTTDDDVLPGTSGDDVIVGLEGTDTIDTTTNLGGTDRVCAGPNALSVDAEGVPRYERVVGGGRFVDGGPGLDRIETGGTTRVLGGSNPTVVDEQGRRWPERIVVNPGYNVEIFGGDGPDLVDVGLDEDGSATVDAGAGHDVVSCRGPEFGRTASSTGALAMIACDPRAHPP